MKYLKYAITLCFLWPIFFILSLLPRSRKIWCFSSYRDSFVDNSKYLFHYASKTLDNVDCYWVTDDIELLTQLKKQGYNAVKRKSLQGIYIMIRAKYVFYSAYVSEVNFWLTAGAKLVNLWHGLPLKKIEFDIDSGHLADKYAQSLNKQNIKNRLFFPSVFRQVDIMTAPSAKMKAIFSSAFRIPESQILTTGMPRTDQFFAPGKFDFPTTFPDWVGDSINSERKIYLYMPTFRDTGGDFFSTENFDFALIQKTMTEVDGEFWIKAHPAVRVYGFDVSKFDRIKVLPSHVDMYPLLSHSFALITDYSSIYIDYMLLDKPIYFYCFDLPEYLANCRSMYFEYEKSTPGEKCLDIRSLCEAIVNHKVDADNASDIKALFWGDNFKNSCDVICQHILDSEGLK